MASPPISNIPVVLFPLKLETRFISDELWIRAFPDMAFIQSHETRLGLQERTDAAQFKQTPPEDRKTAWGDLVNKYGVYRAAWIVQISETEIDAQEQLAAEVGEKAENEAPEFYFKWLPDRLVFYLYKTGEQTPSLVEEGSLIDRDGLTVLGEGDEWLQHFEKAVAGGMAVKVKLNAGEEAFEKIIVSGIRYAEDPVVPAKGLSDLFRNHQYTEGFSFLKYGTPTNNTATAKSGFSARDEYDANGSFPFAVEGLALDTPEEELGIHHGTAGKRLSTALGIEAETLQHAQHADIRPARLNGLFQKASWFAMGAQPLFALFGNQISSEKHLAIWDHYTRFVQARGAYDALKVGNQPYGVLPVMNVRKALSGDEGEGIRESDALFDQLWEIMAQLLNRWTAMATSNRTALPRLEDAEDAYTEILKILSMREYSNTYQIRPLRYDHFQKKLYDWLRTLSTAGTIDALSTGLNSGSRLKKSLNSVMAGRNSLLNLFSTDQVDPDRLIQSPILSITEANTNLIGFREGDSVITDRFGQPVLDENGIEIDQGDLAFSLTQEDLTNFQDLVNKISAGNTTNLLDYQFSGARSVFVDLFFQGYTNARQLYHRDIIPELTTDQLRRYHHLTIGEILQPLQATVSAGDTVMELVSPKNEKIAVTAPFAGRIEKLKVSTGDTFQPGMTLFNLKNADQVAAIDQEFAAMGQALIDELNAIADPGERKAAQMEALREVLDLNSYRVDAWITSLATRRIEEMRSQEDYEKGIYFGAYGWVEGLQKNTTNPVDKNALTDTYKGEGGIIHATSPAQAVASAIFKNSFMSYKDIEATNPFTLNLISDRLQKSQVLLDGIRQGQELEALLGYRLERYLHEHPNGGLHNEIYTLREAFPLYENITADNGTATGFVNLSVIDGLKAIENKDNLPDTIHSSIKPLIKAYIEKLEDVVDGSLDALMYEAGYQVTQGNLSQAAAAMDAARGEIEPPQIESIKTRIPGVGLSHKLILGLSAPDAAYPISNCRAFAEPALENWLAENIGDLQQIGFAVVLTDTTNDQEIETIDLNLQDLGLGYLDLLYVSRDPVDDSASELELRIWKQVISLRGDQEETIQFRITDPFSSGLQPLSSALEVFRSAYRLFSKCRPVKSEDLHLESEAVEYATAALEAIRTNRLVPILDQMKTIVQNATVQMDDLHFLTKLDIGAAQMALLGGQETPNEKIIAEVKEKVAAAEATLSKFQSTQAFNPAFELLQEAAKTLFGSNFILLPPALGSASFAQLLAAPNQQLLVGDKANNTKTQSWGQERVQNWVQGLAQVHENTEVFEEWQLIRTAWEATIGLVQNEAYRIVQGPTMLQYPWLALSKTEIDEVLQTHYQNQEVYKHTATGETYPLADGSYYPDGCDSTVIYATPEFELAGQGNSVAVFGLVIEEFAEHIPHEKVDTGLSFHYNAPNNEPPQAILLAVHPKATMPQNFFWSEEDLRDIIYDTMDLYKVRMVDTDTLQEYGYLLPMANWYNIPSAYHDKH